MIAEVREALGEPQDGLPGLRRRGYELAGFVWYHGWNDGVDPKNAVPEYEQNLVNLIKDVRKDLKAPNLPVVIGELTGPWVEAPGAWATLRKAQAGGRAAGVQGQRAVRRDARLRPQARGLAQPRPRPPRVRQRRDLLPGRRRPGQGDGQAARAAGQRSRAEPRRTPHRSHTVRQIEGWTVRVDDRLLQAAERRAGHAGLRFLENKLADIKAVVPADRLKKLQAVTIVLDLNHGKLRRDAVPPRRRLAQGERLLDGPGEVRPPAPGGRPAHAAEHQRAAVGDPARAGPRLPRPGARLRRAAHQGGLRASTRRAAAARRRCSTTASACGTTR